jgi:pimeloyl-ACP methyl ester carboxylesterase
VSHAAPKLNIVQEGEGEPIVMVHGVISTHRYWTNVMPFIDTTKYKVIRPELVGYGDSPKPKDFTYTVDNQVQVLHHNVRPLATPPYILVGHSMGAAIALHWAVEQPAMFSKVVLTGVPLLNSENLERQLAWVVVGKLIPRRLAKMAVWGVSLFAYVPARLMVLFVRGFPRFIGEDITKHSRSAYLDTLKHMVNEAAILDELSRVAVPTTLIISTTDEVTKPGLKHLREVVAANDALTLVECSCGHNIPLEDPELVAKAVIL